MKFARKADFYKIRLATNAGEPTKKAPHNWEATVENLFACEERIFALGQRRGISEVYVSIEANAKSSY